LSSMISDKISPLLRISDFCWSFSLCFGELVYGSGELAYFRESLDNGYSCLCRLGAALRQNKTAPKVETKSQK
jgi:hypothetical protein